ncbi:hypothetical protein [Cytobacillus praedii]|uniref:hypothetical protein n=1 Tax=Cytobacillus praedii TaxID=1742358 RepID=UPI003AF89A71
MNIAISGTPPTSGRKLMPAIIINKKIRSQSILGLWMRFKLSPMVKGLPISFIALSSACNFNEFILCVVKELDRVIKQRGILGYRQEWQNYTFPVDGFLALKYACLYNKPFEITKSQSGTSIDEELHLLIKNID